jgi:undecaprenyl-diphosphatase
MDTRLYLDVERLARNSAWAHGLLRGVVLYGGAAAVAVLLIGCWWRARQGLEPSRGVAMALWVVLGAVLAAGLSAAAAHAVGRAHPYQTIHGVTLLVPRTGGFSFPNVGATVAGAAIAGISLFERKVFTALALLVGLVWAFALVYVGIAYPADVVAGLLVGAVVVMVLHPGGTFVLESAVRAIGGRRTPTAGAVGRPQGDATL